MPLCALLLIYNNNRIVRYEKQNKTFTTEICHTGLMSRRNSPIQIYIIIQREGPILRRMPLLSVRLIVARLVVVVVGRACSRCSPGASQPARLCGRLTGRSVGHSQFDRSTSRRIGRRRSAFDEPIFPSNRSAYVTIANLLR